jgi:hypothetical protein
MTDKAYEHNFEVDSTGVSNETSYCVSDVQHIYVNDINQGNYSSGFVNWSNVSVVGSSFEKQYAFSEGYLAVPYEVSVEVTTGAMRFDTGYSYAAALSHKGSHHFIDWCSIKMNGVSVNRNTHEFDNGKSIWFVSDNVGEANNETVSTSESDLTDSFRPTALRNDGWIDETEYRL